MKTNYKLLINKKAVFSTFVLIICLPILFSCNEEEFLEETPLSFYAPENSYVNYDDFVSATNNLYAVYRDAFFTNRKPTYSPRLIIIASDLLSFDTQAADFQDQLVAENNFVYTSFWEPAYNIIFDANVIIGRSEAEASELTDEEITAVQAEARFFRGYMYKLLADIYSGVPITLEETTEPKRDYVRASREEVYEQSVSDLVFAAENLPDISEAEDFRVNNVAAYHALTEAYLSLEEWGNAITAASNAISNPGMALMTERFGSRIDDEYNDDFPWASGGDPYWDLFRQDNQNRSSGNTEAIWVLEYEYNVSGGADGGFRYETAFNSRFWKLQVENDDGDAVTIVPYINTYYGGRGAGQTQLNDYFYNYIWDESGEEDIRNSDYNIIRDVKVNNPDSDYDGKWLFADNCPVIKATTYETRDWSPMVAKICSMGDHPEDLWLEDQTVYGSISSAGGPANTTYADIYRMRLAETYLLRAEAYFRKGELANAANDINKVRSRANATDIESNDVTLDYILDERARELTYEENRLQTLARLGILVERINKYNLYFDFYDYQDVFPIPYSEIEKNTGAVLEQNPGY